MTVCCPSCSTRHALTFAAQGGFMTCRSCGLSWRDAETLEAIDISTPPLRHLPAVIDHEDGPDVEASRLVQMARDAKEEHQLQRDRQRRTLQQWAVFGSFVIAPFVAAAVMPETVVNAAPISIKAYTALGYDINVYGLEVRSVQREHITMDGQRILSVKGLIANVDGNTRKIPWLRFALTGPSGEELYSWTLDTGSKPLLRPGESTSFVTRVSAPPEASQNLQIRFARHDEISLNGPHDTPNSQ